MRSAPIPLTSDGVIEGVVLVGSRLAAGVAVIVTSPVLTQTQTAVTDEQGRYRIDGLPAPATFLVTYYIGGVTTEREVLTRTDGPTIVSATLHDPTENKCDALGLSSDWICFVWNGRLVKLASDGTRIP